MAYSAQLLETPATHARYSIFRLLDAAWSAFAETLTGSSLRSVRRLAMKNILGILENITLGTLTVVTNSQTFQFGSGSKEGGGLRATLHVKSDVFWMRVALFTDLGLAEAFMFGDVDCDDVSSLIQILIANRAALDAGTKTLLTSVLAKGRVLTQNRFIGSLANSRANISAHYDLGNTMFASFLSEDMNYSAAIFRDLDEDLKPDSDVGVRESLEEAQMRKVRLILKKANIQPGQRVLEIGMGWGSLAILAAQTYACTVDTVTLSENQADLARQRIASLGLGDKITIHVMDFREARNKPEWAGAFDRFVSVEMIEHVGKPFFDEYWAVADWALKKDTGVGVVQGITIPEARVASYDKSMDFAQKWYHFKRLHRLLYSPMRAVFPGGYLPSLNYLVQTLTTASSGRLIVDSVHNIGPHYARTLREWKRRFLANWDSVSLALVDQYALDEAALEVFRRKWICTSPLYARCAHINPLLRC
ncbi:CFS1-like protein [Mycena kentingensis (nom. inval.)]|nr:CFS1-like protein [Mycena kentingensis (nom. inval.)]